MSQERFITPKEARPPLFAGIDLGGTNIKVGIIDDLGRPLAWHTVPTEAEEGPEAGSRRMGEGVHEVARRTGLERDEIARVGLGSPGSMDIPAGMLLEPANLKGWRQFPLRDRVAHYCRLPVSWENDANAAAFGEFWIGSGRDLKSMALLTLGTGIGCGIVLDGKILDGQHSHGGEFGHAIIDCDDDARVCGCGQLGHVEAYASATAVVKRTRELLEVGRPTSLHARIAAGEELSPKLVAEEAEAGDELSLEIIRQTARYLGISIVTLMHTIDPDGVLLGGAMTFGGKGHPLGERFLQWIKDEVKLRAYRILSELTVIDFAALGGDAGYIGAAAVARQDYYKGEGK